MEVEGGIKFPFAISGGMYQDRLCCCNKRVNNNSMACRSQKWISSSCNSSEVGISGWWVTLPYRVIQGPRLTAALPSSTHGFPSCSSCHHSHQKEGRRHSSPDQGFSIKWGGNNIHFFLSHCTVKNNMAPTQLWVTWEICCLLWKGEGTWMNLGGQ